MRKVSYLTALTLVGISSVVVSTFQLLAMVGIYYPDPLWQAIASWFGQPIPAMLRYGLLGFSVPVVVNTALCVALSALVLRRVWLMASSRTVEPPASYRTWLCVVLLMGLIFAALGIATFVGFQGSGIPGAIVLMPATILLPNGIALTEILSFREGHKRPNT